ncbi:Mphase phosphoprotein 10, putative [Acanthamoeba castellanii str. Neff]|uniref:U3 small nucleolar ribonucleoprotein protein MPP10 n=1 Tax=Acanthamoeba castellanii (strain ATCC 30010 / Neff) TaxID=1257118 RepID=L8H879_ACACF|nr:Mphase phosphoprotein 10, putative [Acanthamoeba castellanii str. Neff]ELR21370.1 Mphase phosphoprotein 10, putative [Acanthamoeba castellanii str. Neff]
MPKRKGGAGKQQRAAGQNGGVAATGGEWKEVEKLATEVALHPEAFVGGDEALSHRLAQATKHLFDLSRRWENTSMTQHGGPLRELTLDGFDSEQVWEQLALHHTPLLRHLRRQSYNLAAASEKRPRTFFPFVGREPEVVKEQHMEEEDESEDMEEEEEEEKAMVNGDEGEAADDDEEEESLENGSLDADVTGEEDEDEGDDVDEEEDDVEENEDKESKNTKATKQQQQTGKKQKKQVKDRFFSFDDMERFIEEGELAAEKERDEEDGIARSDDDDDLDGGLADDLEDIEAEDEEGALDMELMGGDFDEDEDDEDDDGGGDDDDGDESALGGGIKYDQFFDAPEGNNNNNNTNKKSSNKKKGLEEKIAELEDQIVGAKPWQLRGEVDSRKRPLNSLLEEHVEFETAIKQAPVITEEVTMALEDIIKRRIVEGSFDDVVRREEDEIDTRKPRPELDFAKSQKSLAELYEDEYLKSVDKANAANEKPQLAAVLEQKRSKDQEEVLRRFAHLAYKLDALSNFHFTPRPVVPDLAVKENVAAIRMEEIIPIGVSDSSLLAPQEIFAVDRKTSALPSNDSASQKKLRRKKRKHTGSKVNNGMPKGKNVKRAEKVVGGPMTSTKLFKQLTQENQAAKGGKLPTKAPRQQDAPTGARKDTGFKL